MTVMIRRRYLFLLPVLLLCLGNTWGQRLPFGFRELSLPASSDSLQLSVLTVAPSDGEYKGVVQLVHGMCEHKERYIPFMRFLAENGYAVIIHDHRGHGASVHSQEDLGYFYEGGYRAMIEDVRLVGGLARELYPDRPLYLFGHSMGSMAVRAYCKRYDDEIDGLIVCGSPSYNPASGIGRNLAQCAGRRHGDHYRPKKIQQMAFGSFSKRFKDEPSANAWICSDPEVVAAYDANPLCNYQFTANGFVNLFGLMQDAYAKKGWRMAQPDLPIVFISGSEDPCLGNERKFNAAVKRMQQAGYSDVKSKLYPGMRHEILNEVDKAMVWNDVLIVLDTWNNNKR